MVICNIKLHFSNSVNIFRILSDLFDGHHNANELRDNGDANMGVFMVMC